MSSSHLPPLDLVRMSRDPERFMQRVLVAMTLGPPKTLAYRPRKPTAHKESTRLEKRRGD